MQRHPDVPGTGKSGAAGDSSRSCPGASQCVQRPCGGTFLELGSSYIPDPGGRVDLNLPTTLAQQIFDGGEVTFVDVEVAGKLGSGRRQVSTRDFSGIEA